MQLLSIKLFARLLEFQHLALPLFLSEQTVPVVANYHINVVVVLYVHLDVVEDVPVANGFVVDISRRGNRRLSLHKLGKVVVLHISQGLVQVLDAPAAQVVQIGFYFKQFTVKHHQT